MPRTYVVIALTFVSAAFADDNELIDDFDGEFALLWSILREDDSHYSLETHPGELALTTQAGSMYANNENGWANPPKNLFLLRDAIGNDTDFEATLHVSSYEPNKHYQQVALLLYQSDEHYLKWSMEQREDGDPSTSLAVVLESKNLPEQGEPRPMAVDGPFWLRLARVDDEYRFSYSNDGDEFVQFHARTWQLDPQAKRPRIGFVAKNGNPLKEEATFVVESFRLVTTEANP